jgi:winged helix-turn-helix protein
VPSHSDETAKYFVGPAFEDSLYHTDNDEREKACGWKIMRSPHFYELTNDSWYWRAVGIPLDLIDKSLQGDIDILFAARQRASGIATSLPARGQPGRKLDGHLHALRGEIAAHPDATLAELVAWTQRQRGVTVCVATMWATLNALGITLKKRRATPPSRNARMLPRPDGPGVRSKRA